MWVEHSPLLAWFVKQELRLKGTWRRIVAGVWLCEDWIKRKLETHSLTPRSAGSAGSDVELVTEGAADGSKAVEQGSLRMSHQ